MAGEVNAGKLRKRIIFQARSTSIDTMGGQSTTWSEVIRAWASIEPASGRELLAAQAMNIEQPSTIIVRWRTELSNPKTVGAMRVLYGSRILNIHSSQNTEERNREIVLLASEGLNNG